MRQPRHREHVIDLDNVCASTTQTWTMLQDIAHAILRQRQDRLQSDSVIQATNVALFTETVARRNSSACEKRMKLTARGPPFYGGDTPSVMT